MRYCRNTVHARKVCVRQVNSKYWADRRNIRKNKLKINRIVTNIEAKDLEAADEFYRDLFVLELLMDHGWIRTYGSSSKMNIQISIATKGGAGTSVPDISIEYGPKSEPWGVRRFYIRVKPTLDIRDY